MAKETDILDIIKANPGATSSFIHYELVRRTRAAKWFGNDSFLAILFGPSLGWMYVKLHSLEMRSKITSELESHPIGCEHRPRRYWPVIQILKDC
jgi:hypothetical protein